MPIAAVPDYLLKQDLSQASPGLRFGLYLPIWTNRADQEREINERASKRSREGQELSQYLQQEGMDHAIDAWLRRRPNPLPALWEKNDHGAQTAWTATAKFNRQDLMLMSALTARQAALAAPLAANGQLLRIAARSVAPFTTGLGNEHPLENGFAFLNPYGLPYLPASGVKGVVRQAARELASGQWGDPGGWDDAGRYALHIGKRNLTLSLADVLFGRQTEDRDTEHLRGALRFWDVIPGRIAGDRLLVEVMTPHQTHYYQKGENPHESGSPNPISFLTVPPGSDFAFHVECDRAFLARHAPDLVQDDTWQNLLRAAFAHAFAWLGFGAKTAVGYGAMSDPEQASASANRGASGDATAAPPQTRETVRQTWSGVTLKLNAGNGEVSVTGQQGQVARVNNPDAERLRATLTPEQQTRLKGKKELKGCAVTVEKTGNAWRIVAMMP